MFCEECSLPLVSALLLTLSHLGIYFMHPTVWLTAAAICDKTQEFPKLNLKTNHSQLVLDVQIIMLYINNQIDMAQNDKGCVNLSFLNVYIILHLTGGGNRYWYLGWIMWKSRSVNWWSTTTRRILRNQRWAHKGKTLKLPLLFVQGLS